MCKLDLKDAYFCIPLAEESKKFVRFVGGRPISIHVSMLSTCSRLLRFQKLLKISIAFLPRIGTLIIIYLGDMLLIGRIAENVQTYLDTVTLFCKGWGL